jgi:hypothetical protein
MRSTESSDWSSDVCSSDLDARVVGIYLVDCSLVPPTWFDRVRAWLGL